MLVIEQCKRTVEVTVNTSCLHVSGQDASFARAIVAPFAKLAVSFFVVVVKTYNRCLFFSLNFVITLINW